MANNNDRSSSSARRSYPPCPDGGWGWMVVFGSFMIHVIADGIIYSFGLFYYELAKHFGESKTATSMVVSIMNGTTYCIGPIASALTIRFGCRAVTIAGSIFASLGFFLSTFAPNIFTLYGTIGICAGVGFGLMYLPAIVIVTSYFEKRRAFATGIAVCGSGIGTAIMSPLIEYIINLYGWKGAMLVISALLINCGIFGAMFKPVPSIKIEITTDANHHNINDDDDDNPIELKESTKSMLVCMENPKDSSIQSSVEIHLNPEESINGEQCDDVIKQRSHSFTPGFLYREDSFYSGSLMNIHKSEQKLSTIHHQQQRMDKIKRKSDSDCCLFKKLNFPDEIKENLSEMIDLSLMRNQVFLIFSISNFLTAIGYHIPFIFLKDWIVDNRIGSPQETGFFTSIIGLFSTISRLVFGYISDHSFVNRLWLYTFSVTLCGLIIISNTLATTYKLLAIFCAFFGITCGTYVSLTSVVLVDLLSLEKLTNAFGLILLFQGVASILGPLFIGFIYDLSGAYDTGFHVIGSLVTFSGLMLILIPICNNFKSMKKLFLY
ncbi:monocarboxylate transporter 5-like [Dermatophagoides farinae]|uniref:Monocarboxylate transporter 5-like n=1 Tax=Dermatophagoides farinae TaxID=6954 RepID=A0A9D4P033_DERFA|nr:monocarboxylate transporter 4-like [Dermatophagoides farinae]KAH7641473.1 monocarboxylate transporter 5-like [Dermatophagoides farinae]